MTVGHRRQERRGDSKDVGIADRLKESLLKSLSPSHTSRAIEIQLPIPSCMARTRHEAIAYHMHMQGIGKETEKERDVQVVIQRRRRRRQRQRSPGVCRRQTRKRDKIRAAQSPERKDGARIERKQKQILCESHERHK